MRPRCRSRTLSKSSRCSTARRFEPRSRSTSPTSSSPRSRRSTPRRSPRSKSEGWRVAPSAKAVQLTMNRDGIRDFAANRARPRHVEISLRREPRRGDRGGGRSRSPVRGQAGDVELGQGPEHREDSRRGGRGVGLCGRQHARRPAARDRRGIYRVRQRDHLADRRDARRRAVLRAGRAPPGSGRLSRKLAARGYPSRGAAVGPIPGAQDRRCARRPWHLRGRILRPRRPGDLLRAFARARTTRAW